MKKLILLVALITIFSQISFAKPAKAQETIPEYEENKNFDIVQFEKEEGIYTEKPESPEENISEDSVEPAVAEEVPENTEEAEETDEEQDELTEDNEDEAEEAEEITDEQPAEPNPLDDSLKDFPDGFDLTSLLQKENLLVIPRRTLEIGFKTDAGLSNNFFNAKEVLQKDLVIDLTEMSEDVSDDGWQIDFLLNSELYFNFSFNRKLQIGFANGVESYGYMNISKKLFDYLGKGFNLYEVLKVDGKIDADAFFYSQAKIGYSWKGFHFTAKPALVKPLVHVENEEMYGTYHNPADGSMKVSAIADIKFYGGVDLEPILEGNFSFSDIASNLFKDCGFDLELAAEHKVFDSLQAGVYARIPMVPGDLTYTADWEITYNYEVDGLKALLQGDYEDPEYNYDNKVYGTGSYKIHRPFKTGVEFAWRPFGEWSTFRGMAGLGVKKPFTGDAKAYFEYNLGYEVLLLHTVGAWISTSYKSEIFKHELGLIFNFHVAEIDLGVSLQGSNFKYSFMGSGAGAYLGLCFGF